MANITGPRADSGLPDTMIFGNYMSDFREGVPGKGSEQAMVVAGGKKVTWDDRKVVREELEKLGYNK